MIFRENHEDRLPRLHDDALDAVRNDPIRKRRKVNQREIQFPVRERRQRPCLVLLFVHSDRGTPRLIPQPPRQREMQKPAVPA